MIKQLLINPPVSLSLSADFGFCTLLPCHFEVKGRPWGSSFTYSTMDERLSFFSWLSRIMSQLKTWVFYASRKISGSTANIKPTNVWSAFIFPPMFIYIPEETPKSICLWQYSEGNADERFSLKGDFSTYTFHHDSSLWTSTSARPHITVIPFKAQQLSLVLF